MPFTELSKQMRSMLDALQGDQLFGTRSGHGWQPRINVYEVPDAYWVCVELAGVPSDEIDIRVESGILYICGTRPKPSLPAESPTVGVHTMEIDSGAFSREVPLPSDVVIERITANYRDGYLWIELRRAQ